MPQAAPLPQSQQELGSVDDAALQPRPQEEEPLQEEPSLSLQPQGSQGQAPAAAASQLLPLLDPQQYQLAAEQLLQMLIKEGARPPSPPAEQGAPCRAGKTHAATASAPASNAQLKAE